MNRKSILQDIYIGLMFVCLSAGAALAQTTEFVYQGQLQNGGVPATGNYDFEFLLYDALSGGTQVGATLTKSSVAVANGIFSTKLDFGLNFPGANRFLEIHVRQTGGGAFTPLAPRQQINSTPYSVKSINADSATNAINATIATTAVNFSGSLSGDVTGTQAATAIATGAVTTAKLADNSVTNAKIVDVAGSKITGSVTTATIPGANVTGAVANATNAVNATNATTAVNFSGPLAGDVTGTQAATVIANNAVTNAKIADGSIGNSKITDVQGTKIAGSIATATIPGANVTGAVGTATNATQLGGVAANQYVVTTDPRMTDARTPTAGSGNYIQNTAVQQAASNFNISGNGTAGGTLSGNIVDVTTQYNIGGSRVLSAAGLDNLYAGISAGASNPTSNSNSFFGGHAGANNTTGGGNSFVGARAGQSNMTGNSNSFFGGSTGANSTTASNNSFFGAGAGGFSSTGSDNTFVGFQAGISTEPGNDNAFVGARAGFNNTMGIGNSFVGRSAGLSNTTGSNNTIIGRSADVGASNLTNATAIGANTVVSQSNSLVLGNGVNVGIGTSTPSARLTVLGFGAFNAPGAARFDLYNAAASQGYLQHVSDLGLWQLATTSGATRVVVDAGGQVGIGTAAPNRLLEVGGRARIGSIPQEASIASVCFNAAGDLLQCGASSLRWKTNVQSYRSGLDVIRRLRPISYNWKESGAYDFGLGAEDVAKVDPSLAFTDSKGEVTGVKYEKMSLLLINAVKEQQAQIEAQAKQIDRQNAVNKNQELEIEALKSLVCRSHRRSAVCRAKN